MATAAAENAARARAASDRAFTCEEKGDLAGAVQGCDEALLMLADAEDPEELQFRAHVRERKIRVAAGIRAGNNGTKSERPAEPAHAAAPMRECVACGREWPETPEHFRPAGPDGSNLRHRCRRCDRERENARHAQKVQVAGQPTRRPGRPRATSPQPPAPQVEPVTSIMQPHNAYNPPQVSPDRLERCLRWCLRQVGACSGDERTAAVDTSRLLAGLLAGSGIGAENLFGLAVEVLAG